jgi:hypothetical protein
MTLADFFGEQGLDWKTAMQEIAAERQFADSLGIVIGTEPQQMAPVNISTPIEQMSQFDCGTGSGGFKPGNDCAGGGKNGNGDQEEQPAETAQIKGSELLKKKDADALYAKAEQMGIDSSRIEILTDDEMSVYAGENVLGNFNKSSEQISIRQELPEGWTHEDVLAHEGSHVKFEAWNKDYKKSSVFLNGPNLEKLNEARYSPTEYTDKIWATVPTDVPIALAKAQFKHALNETVAEMNRIGGVFPETPPVYAELFKSVMEQ